MGSDVEGDVLVGGMAVGTKTYEITSFDAIAGVGFIGLGGLLQACTRKAIPIRANPVHLIEDMYYANLISWNAGCLLVI